MKISKLALAVTSSGNRKVGIMAATYASRASCATDCPLKDKGCYAISGKCGLHVNRLDRDATAVQVAKAEAKAIESMAIIPGLPLRGHVSGDCPTPQCAKIVGNAYRSYHQRGGGQAYTYTHAWRKVPRAAWGEGVTVLASCENMDQVKKAQAQGYTMFAVIMQELPAKTVKVDGLKVIPCQYQAKGTQCVTCKLCLKEKDGTVIAFAPDNKSASQVLFQG